MTGYRAETTLLRSVGAAVDAPLHAPVYDPATFETTVPNLFVVGACVAGKQSGMIFIENGRFHGEVAVRTIADRLDITRDVKDLKGL
jgi:thioredoxin reductase (NADPH)